MADITPSHLRGFIAPFKFTSDHFWSDESTVTQNGEYAGIPSSDDAPTLQLVTKGTQTRSVEVVTRRAGHVTDNAGYVWKYEGDTDYYGAEVANKITDFQMLQAGSTTLNQKYIPRKALRLTSGTVLVAHEYTTITDSYARLGRITVDGIYSYTSVHLQDLADLRSNSRYPTICEMPDGSVLYAVWVVDGASLDANIHMYRSTDDGQTFELVSSKALPENYNIDGSIGAGAEGYDLQPLAMASSAHQVLLFAGLYLHDSTPTYGSRIAQYASSNTGMTFDLIDTASDADASHFYLPQLVEHNGVFIIAYISESDAIDFTRLSNAYDSVFDTLGIISADTLAASCAVISGNRLIDGSITMNKDTDGRLYLYGAISTPSAQGSSIRGAYSDLAGIGVEDYASKWQLMGDATAFANADVYTNATGGGLWQIQTCAGQGEQLLFCNYQANLVSGSPPVLINTYAYSLMMFSLGGWSTQQYPRLNSFPDDYQWGYNTRDFVPADLPDAGASGWTKTTTGSSAQVLIGSAFRLSCDSTTGDSVKFAKTITDKTAGLLVHTQISGVSGGSFSTGTAFGVQIQSQTPYVSSTYYVEVVIGSDRIHMYNKHTSTLIASATGLNLPDGVQILMYVDNKTGDVFLNYAGAGSPLQYTELSGTLTLDSNSTQQVYWGVPLAPSTGVVRCDYRFFSYGQGSANGLGWSTGDTNARQYAGRGFYTTVKDGLELSTIDGAARENDTYTINPQYGSPVQRVLHSVSPSAQVGWKSDTVADADATAVPAQKIAFMMNTTLQGTADTHTQSQATGIHLTGINCKEIAVEVYQSGAWSKIATVYNTVNGASGWSFTRQGAAVTCTDADGVYLHLNECAGWSILLVDGLNSVQRRIESSGSGVLAATSSKRAYLTLSGVKSTDPTSGTAYLIPSACTVVLNQNQYAGIRLSLSSQKTAEGRFEIGTMVMGSVVITSPQYGRGRTIAFESNVIESELPSGTLYSQRRGAGGRVVRVAWTDGVDTSSLFADPADPDHYSLYSGEPIAARGDAPTTMMGLVQYVNGSRDAVVYLPSLPKLPSTHITLNRYHDHILCTMGSDMQIEHVIGDEGLSENGGEVFRVSTVVLREVR